MEKLLNKILTSLESEMQTSITYRVPPIWIVNPIKDDASIGKQIKYYRRLANIKQEDLSIKLGYSRDALHHIENKEMKLVDINLINGIIEELKLHNKLKINDEYILFLLDNPCEKIKTLRKQMNMSLKAFGNLIGVSETSVRRWEQGNNHISREKYEKLKKCMK